MSTLLQEAAVQAGLTLPAVDSPEAWAELAVDVFLRPRAPSRIPLREQNYLATAKRGVAQTRWGELVQWTWGSSDAPLVMLAHGWAGRAAQLGAMAEPLVAAGFHVLAFDGPAHGESPGREAHVPMLAECILEIATQQGGLRAVIGHSAGAASAALATLMGLKPRGLVLIAPPLSHRRRIERLADRFQLSLEVRTAFFTAAERRVGWKDTDIDMRVVARLAPSPALILHDPNDDRTEFVGSVEFTALWRGSRLVPCPGRGHFRILSTPEVVDEAVRFVAAL